MGTLTQAEAVALIEQFKTIEYVHSTPVPFNLNALRTLTTELNANKHCKDLIWLAGKSVGGALAGFAKPGQSASLKDLFDYNSSKQPTIIGHLLGSEVIVDKNFGVLPIDVLIYAVVEFGNIVQYKSIHIAVNAL